MERWNHFLDNRLPTQVCGTIWFIVYTTAFSALSDRTRRGILEYLGREEASINDLAASFDMTLMGIKKYIRVLEDAGLVTTEKVSRVRYGRLGTSRLRRKPHGLRGTSSFWKPGFRAWASSWGTPISYRIHGSWEQRVLRSGKAMKYFMIESTFHDPVPVSEDQLQLLIKEHQRYLARGFAEGWILVSGPKTFSDGGVILMKADSPQEIEAYFNEDPMKVAGVQDYKVVEFNLHDCQPMVKDWFC
jgi:DNA-binding transcriptional ArsR family regulator/uncharacterized protein YciI